MSPAKNQVKAGSVSLCFFMLLLELNLGGGGEPEPCCESCLQKEFDKIIYTTKLEVPKNISNNTTIRYHYRVKRLLTWTVWYIQTTHWRWFDSRWEKLMTHKTSCAIVCVTPKKRTLFIQVPNAYQNGPYDSGRLPFGPKYLPLRKQRVAVGNLVFQLELLCFHNITGLATGMVTGDCIINILQLCHS